MKWAKQNDAELMRSARQRGRLMRAKNGGRGNLFAALIGIAAGTMMSGE